MNAQQRVFSVKAGRPQDICVKCGIRREYAGFLRETCGAWFLTPECLVDCDSYDEDEDEQT